jgi:hypothetical protein
MAANIALNFLMVAVLDLGAASIAVATSISAVINLFCLTLPLRAEVFGIYAVKMLGACLAAATVALCVDTFFWGDLPAWAIATGALPAYAGSFLMQCTRLVVDCLAFFGVYGLLFLKIR